MAAHRTPRNTRQLGPLVGRTLVTEPRSSSSELAAAAITAIGAYMVRGAAHVAILVNGLA
ncbi:MAG: hypothetical protein AAF628_26615 [Planctomycetota bacterium]